MTSGLCVTGLAVERSGKPVIHGVDVAIAPGQITALLGANGAGKSSQLHCSGTKKRNTATRRPLKYEI